MSEIQEVTKRLLQQNEAIWELYLANQKEQQAFDFYKDMKPFVDAVKETCDAWLLLVIPWVRKDRPTYIGEAQLRQATDNIQMIAVSAFNGKSFYKHFNDHYQSVEYTLKRVLEKAP
ncbi:YppE family protein [Listeria booriae]|uniref:YppE family protein n=1 Tax=Listeria booriae TaxID=1552123 RepID=UPI0016235584|nr:YppE family protein [Listeria booriae]MBC2023173.1 YppE family protein [Listeria booriae]